MFEGKKKRVGRGGSMRGEWKVRYKIMSVRISKNCSMTKADEQTVVDNIWIGGGERKM